MGLQAQQAVREVNAELNYAMTNSSSNSRDQNGQVNSTRATSVQRKTQFQEDLRINQCKCAFVNSDFRWDEYHIFFTFTLTSSQNGKASTIFSSIDIFWYMRVEKLFILPETKLNVDQLIFSNQRLNYLSWIIIFSKIFLVCPAHQKVLFHTTDNKVKHLTLKYGADLFTPMAAAPSSIK